MIKKILHTAWNVICLLLVTAAFLGAFWLPYIFEWDK